MSLLLELSRMLKLSKLSKNVKSFNKKSKDVKIVKILQMSKHEKIATVEEKIVKIVINYCNCQKWSKIGSMAKSVANFVDLKIYIVKETYNSPQNVIQLQNSQTICGEFSKGVC